MTTVDPSIYQHLGYKFADPELLQQALTHRSFASKHNERLEFLGDSLLNCIIAEDLYFRFPNESEGTLSRLRASLVKGDTLSELARELSLSDYLILGQGELKSGGYKRRSTLADALEAIIGAIYIDSNMWRCKTQVLQWYASRLEAVNPKMGKDPKTQLQEWLQAHKKPLPEYRLLKVDGDANHQIFEVECVVDMLPKAACGMGSSRRRAEQAAAERVLDVLENLP